MAVVDCPGGSLTNQSYLIEWVTDTLTTTYGFTQEYTQGSTAANTLLRWISRASGTTFTGNNMLLGLRKSTNTRGADTVPIQIGMSMSNSTWGVVNPGTGDRWIDASMPTSSFPLVAITTPSIAPVGVDNMGTGPYVRARMITNATIASGTPSEEIYVYVIVEVTSGVFRQFGFGEIIKFYDFTGGLFFMGSQWGSTASMFSANHGSLFGSGRNAQSLADANSSDTMPGFVYAPGWQGISDAANGNGWMPLQNPTSGGGGFQARGWPCMGLADPRLGFAYGQQSPSAFSLQSQRYPCVLAGGNSRISLASVHPMGQFPDLYSAVITDVDAYGVFQEADGSKYMVVPHRTKTVDEFTLGGSGRHGILIRNPALTVTI